MKKQQMDHLKKKTPPKSLVIMANMIMPEPALLVLQSINNLPDFAYPAQVQMFVMNVIWRACIFI